MTCAYSSFSSTYHLLVKVAAMFKIGNSKELPAIPDHLSNDGKDFVRLCLQRNPIHRPTAAQLLEHRFVKNAAPLEKAIVGREPSAPPTGITKGVNYVVMNVAFSLLE